MRYPDEPTTPQQWQVIAWASIAIFLLIGTVGFVAASGAAPEKAEMARQTRSYSYIFYGLAIAVYGLMRLLSRFVG